nr:hypothetical protein [Tanacetum cinerariifolium]
MMRIKMKNPPLDQTGSPRDEEKEKSQSQQVLQRKRHPKPLVSLLKGPNLIKRLQASLHQQRSQCRLLKIWKSPHIKSSRQVLLMINLLQKLLNILNGFRNKRNLQLLIVLGTRHCQQYPHNLLKPLPLIPNSRGRRVMPFDHFINNDLEYLRGGASSRKYTTSVTKTKAADYGHIKWIEDLFYGFTVNRESARDVYSKRRIIVVTELQIVEWHDYKHLDWITVRRDDDKLYKFKEGDFKR